MSDNDGTDILTQEKSAQNIAIDHLEKLREAANGQIRERVAQRDQYAVQLTIALGTILGVALTSALSDPGASMADILTRAHRVLLAAPLVSIYFTFLIFYSYRIHNLLALNLKREVEPRLSELCGTPIEVEWEYYQLTYAEPGMRRVFFLVSLWTTTIGSLLVILLIEVSRIDRCYELIGDPFFQTYLILCVPYVLSCIWLTSEYRRLRRNPYPARQQSEP